MFKAIVVIGTLAANSAGQLEDQQGPYAALKVPIVYAVGVCIRVPKTEKGEKI